MQYGMHDVQWQCSNWPGITSVLPRGSQVELDTHDARLLF